MSLKSKKVKSFHFLSLSLPKEIKNVLLEEALNERADEEMELSDLESDSSGHSNKENGEPPRAKKMRLSGEDAAKTVHQLKVRTFMIKPRPEKVNIHTLCSCMENSI